MFDIWFSDILCYSMCPDPLCLRWRCRCLSVLFVCCPPAPAQCARFCRLPVWLSVDPSNVTRTRFVSACTRRLPSLPWRANGWHKIIHHISLHTLTNTNYCHFSISVVLFSSFVTISWFRLYRSSRRNVCVAHFVALHLFYLQVTIFFHFMMTNAFLLLDICSTTSVSLHIWHRIFLFLRHFLHLSYLTPVTISPFSHYLLVICFSHFFRQISGNLEVHKAVPLSGFSSVRLKQLASHSWLVSCLLHNIVLYECMDTHEEGETAVFWRYFIYDNNYSELSFN